MWSLELAISCCSSLLSVYPFNIYYYCLAGYHWLPGGHVYRLFRGDGGPGTPAARRADWSWADPQPQARHPCRSVDSSSVAWSTSRGGFEFWCPAGWEVGTKLLGHKNAPFTILCKKYRPPTFLSTRRQDWNLRYANSKKREFTLVRVASLVPLVLCVAPACQCSCIQGWGAAPHLAAPAPGLPILEPAAPAALLV